MKRWIQLSLAALLAVVLYAVWFSYSSPLRISASEAKRQIKDQTIKHVVDVRTDLEVETLGSYPGSIHIPAAELPVRAASQLGKNDAILLYCNTGQRARSAAETLQSLGYTRVRYIAEPYALLM